MAGASILALIITIWGLILIARTLNSTKEAAGFASQTLTEAGNTTKAANETTDVTREMSIAQNRAYIDITGFRFGHTDTHSWPVNNGHIQISGWAFLKNLGMTPATNITYRFRFSFSKKGRNRALRRIFATEMSENYARFGILMQGADTESSNQLNSQIFNPAWEPDVIPTVVNIVDGDFVRAVVRCEYDDVFDNRWFVEKTFEGYCSVSSMIKFKFTSSGYVNRTGRVEPQEKEE